MKKIIFQILIVAGIMSFVYVNLNVTANTQNSKISLSCLIKNAFAQSEIPDGGCVYCGYVFGCICDEVVDCKPGVVIRRCMRATGESVTPAYYTSNVGFNVGLDLGLSSGYTYHPAVTTVHYVYGEEAVCIGDVNGNGCTPIPCNA